MSTTQPERQDRMDTTMQVRVRRVCSDPAMNGYYAWYFDGVTAQRALELAAWTCAAQCVDYIALECAPA